jgi:hypothetical protein
MKIAGLTCVAAIIFALTSMPSAEAANGKRSAKSKPLRVTVHPTKRRRGGYSYSKSDSISAADTYRFIDPPRQSLGGPFDNGFFFDSPAEWRGGSSPYMH